MTRESALVKPNGRVVTKPTQNSRPLPHGQGVANPAPPRVSTPPAPSFDPESGAQGCVPAGPCRDEITDNAIIWPVLRSGSRSGTPVRDAGFWMK